MNIDGNQTKTALETVIDGIIAQLGGGGKMENCKWAFTEETCKQSKDKKIVTAALVGKIKKTFEEDEEEDVQQSQCYNNNNDELKFSITLSCITEDLTPPEEPESPEPPIDPEP